MTHYLQTNGDYFASKLEEGSAARAACEGAKLEVGHTRVFSGKAPRGGRKKSGLSSCGVEAPHLEQPIKKITSRKLQYFKGREYLD